ncbi:uncharacterized protein LOC124353019 [Homalodisca vitripennis]|uniref:uncharacterized protein LOC124353019 n=1 Tax=Homalodisca vitripennis TaxID=197043 RepID=UPI001EE9FE32|nr:uncharacterized protein LOC124353019 [Homalodisca vitripennis]
MWEIVNESRGKNQSPCNVPRTVKDDKGVDISDPKLVSNMFNKFFIDVSNSASTSSRRSTVNAMFTLINKIVNALDRGRSASGVFFFDLRKAFDVVSHDIMLEKLEGIGVRGVANQWLSSYLRDRRQPLEVSFIDAAGTVRRGGDATRMC